SYLRARGVPWPASLGIDPTGQAENASAPTTARAPQAAAAPEAEADAEAESETAAEPVLRRATDDHIRWALRAVYDEAKANGGPPPNVKAVRPRTQAWLVQRGQTASENHIGKIADEEEFRRRRRPGKTLKSERRTAPV